MNHRFSIYANVGWDEAEQFAEDLANFVASKGKGTSLMKMHDPEQVRSLITVALIAPDEGDEEITHQDWLNSLVANDQPRFMIIPSK